MHFGPKMPKYQFKIGLKFNGVKMKIESRSAKVSKFVRQCKALIKKGVKMRQDSSNVLSNMLSMWGTIITATISNI